ncbi:MAG: hypothetical protein ACKVWR_01950 [Acidimicrobiales bacterium]
MSGSNLLTAAGGLRFGSARDGPIESHDEERLRAVPVGVGDQLDGFLVVDPVEAHEQSRVVVVVTGGEECAGFRCDEGVSFVDRVDPDDERFPVRLAPR